MQVVVEVEGAGEGHLCWIFEMASWGTSVPSQIYINYLIELLNFLFLLIYLGDKMPYVI